MAGHALWSHQCSCHFSVLHERHFSDLLDVYIIIYLDDILIYSDAPSKHTEHIREVLCRLCKNGLYARPDKCCFSSDTVEYLGFIQSKDGLKMDPSKVQTIQDWPEPRKIKDIQSFLGFANLLPPLHFWLLRYHCSAHAPHPQRNKVGLLWRH